MPNYSHGTKLALAAVDEPPFLTVGTDVSAKYKGAFCEAKIIDVNKHVKLRVLFDGHPGSYMIDDSELKQGSPLEIGSKIEARHPEKKQQVYIHATITKILDQSRYTVVFDDGDQCILRRNSICLKSGKHFAESETLDQLPLTNPEHFGNPVKVGQASLEQNNHNNSTIYNQQQVGNQVTNKLGNNISNNNNNNNNSGSNSGEGKNGFVDFNDQASSTTGNNGRGQNNVKLETDKPSKGKSISASSSSNNANSTSTATNATVATPRRGGGKGRKRRESTSTSAKQTSELDEGPGDESQASDDVEPGESDVNFEAIEIGVKLMVQYGKGKVQNVYEAKVNKIETNSAGRTRYFVHYTGWNNRYDEWITKNRILSIVTDRENGTKDGRCKQPEPNSSSTTTNSSSVASSDSNTNRESIASKDKERERDIKPPAKTSRRSRQVESASKTQAATITNPAIGTLSSTVPSTVVGTKSPLREKEKDREKDKEKEVPTKTRRSRLPVDGAANAPSAVPSSTPEPKAAIKQEDESKEKEKEKVKEKDKEKDRTKDKESAPAPTVKAGRPRLSETVSAPSVEKAQNPPVKEKEPTTKTRRSRQVESANSTATTVAASSASSTASSVSSTPPRPEIGQNDKEKTKERERGAQQLANSKEGRAASKQTESTTPQINQKATSNWSSLKDRETDKDPNIIPTKTRGSKQVDVTPVTSSSTLTSTIASSPSASSPPSVSSATTNTSNLTTTTTSASVAHSTTVASTPVSVSASTNPCKDRERERDRDRDKEPPIKIRRSRQSTLESSGNASSKDTTATTTTTSATTNTTSAASSTSSTASSSSSSSCSLALTNPALSALASISEKEREKFDEMLIIDEPDCDKRISILQDKIMTIRQTYMALKAELADLDRRRKRPRMERSSSDHINNFNSSVTCRN